jgi:hypothetical protein
VGRLGLGDFCFFSNSEIHFYIAQKFIKHSPKLFINKIFVFRLIIIILFTRIFLLKRIDIKHPILNHAHTKKNDSKMQINN